LFSLELYAQTEIQFEKNTTIQALKAKAKKEKKLIFIDAYTSWCGPCKWISANIFTDPKVADYYNKNFINAKFDMEDQGEGTRIGSSYQVMCYPNLLFIDADGKLIHRTAGVDQDPQFYIALGETAKDSKKCFAAVEERYKKEPTNTTYFAEYLTLVSNTCLDFQKDLDSFLFRLTEDDYLQEENWKLIQNHLADFNHKVTQYVSKNTSKFQDKFGDQVGAFLYNSVRQTAFDLLNEPDFQEYKYQLLLKNSKLIEITEIQSIVPMLEVYGFERKGEWDNLFDYLMKNGDTILDSENKNRYSYLISENTISEVYLKKAEKWMLEVIAEGENWNNLDTYAHVLVKLNKKKEALIIAEKSLKRVEELTEEQINATKSFIEEIKTEN
jgi:thiol-disulfide isomerase/thioredoxin